MENLVRSSKSYVRKTDGAKYSEPTDDDRDDLVRKDLTKKYSEA